MKTNDSLLLTLGSGYAINDYQLRRASDAQKYFKKQVQNWKNQEKIKQLNNNYTLTEKGKLYADAIASDLFIV